MAPSGDIIPVEEWTSDLAVPSQPLIDSKNAHRVRPRRPRRCGRATRSVRRWGSRRLRADRAEQRRNVSSGDTEPLSIHVGWMFVPASCTCPLGSRSARPSAARDWLAPGSRVCPPRCAPPAKRPIGPGNADPRPRTIAHLRRLGRRAAVPRGSSFRLPARRRTRQLRPKRHRLRRRECHNPAR